MENEITVSLQNRFLFVKELIYGTNFLHYDTLDILKNILLVTEIHNVINENIIEILSISEDAGIIKMSMKDRSYAFPDLHENNFNIRALLEKAIEEKTLIKLDIDSRLFKFANKIAKEKGIKFINNAFGVAFSGAVKDKPVATQIHEAYMSGADYIQFDGLKVNPGNVRSYTSNLNAITGNSFKCTVSDKTITVFFKNPPQGFLNDKKQSVYKRLEQAIEKGDSFISFTPKDASFQTIRVYASQLSHLVDSKIKCSVKDGILTVWLKEKSASDQLYDEFNKIYNEYKEKLGENAFWEVWNRFEIGTTWKRDNPGTFEQHEIIEEVEYEDEPVERDYEAEAAEWLKNNPPVVNEKTDKEYIQDLYEDDDF